MKQNAGDKDPAFPVMAMSILGNVLSRADNPGDVGIYLTEEVRDLTGARCVLLIQCLSTPTATAHRIISVNPLRRCEWAESPAANRLYEFVYSVSAAQLWRGEEPSEVAGLLRQEGFRLSMVFPLYAGEFRVGTMLVLGLPDEGHITYVLGLLNNLSTIVALVLRNAILYETQERLIQERTAKLRDNNEKLAMELAERKRAEEEICRLNTELDQRVRDRTAERDAANKEVETFNYSMAHDLRAPVRHLSAYVDLLRKRTSEGLDDKSQHYLEAISEAAKEMGGLIDNILSFSRIGRVELVKTRVAMQDLVSEVLQTAQPDLEGKAIEWSVGRLPEVRGSREMLRTVLANLISNALKFTGNTPKAIIEIGCMMEDHGEDVFYVRDNGAGFDMQHARKLFGLFQRLHRADEFEGTGIGLANVRRIVSRHGGRTWAEGVLGQGATFYFSLPREKEEG